MEFDGLDKKFIVLKKDALFVPGPRRGAIYNISDHRLYHLEEKLATILKRSSEGLVIAETMAEAGIVHEKEINITLEMLLGMDCISVGEKAQPFPDIKIQKSPVSPKVAWIEPTDRCNLFCVHCYAQSRLNRNDKGLSTGKWLSIIDELEEIGVKQLVFTGGEPLLRNDLLQLLTHAFLNKNLRHIQILTNASLFTPSPLLDFIAEKEIGVGFSFYSHTAAVHDRMTRTPGSWDKTVQGIKLLVSKKIRPAANIVFTEINEEDVDKTRNFLVSLGLENEDIMSNVVLPTGRGCHSDYHVKNYDHLIRKSYALEDRFAPGGWSDYRGTCWRGKFAIKADGRLIPCTMCREIEIGDIRHKKLSEIIDEGAFDSIWDIDVDSTRICRECELRYACSDCRALTYAFTGNLYAKDPTCPYDPYTGDAADLFFPHLSRQSSISLQAKPQKRKNIVPTRVEGKMVLSNKTDGIHHSLNMVAGEIWELLDGDLPLETVVNILGKHFDKERSLLEKDVVQVVKQFSRLGLLEHAL